MYFWKPKFLRWVSSLYQQAQFSNLSSGSNEPSPSFTRLLYRGEKKLKNVGKPSDALTHLIINKLRTSWIPALQWRKQNLLHSNIVLIPKPIPSLKLPTPPPLFTNPTLYQNIASQVSLIRPRWNLSTNSMPPVTPFSVSIPIMVPVSRKVSPLSRPVRPIIPSGVHSGFREIPSHHVVCSSSRTIIRTP